MTLKCLLTFSFIARHTFSIFCTPSATSHSCIEPKHCNQPVNICNQLLFLSTSSQSEISVHDKTLSERPQTFLLATVPIRSKDRVCWNHICVESFGARVQALLVWGWGGNEREDIVSPFMWHSGSEFKDEMSLQFRGYKVRYHPNCWARLLILLEADVNTKHCPEQSARCNRTTTIKSATSTFYE